MASSSTPAQWPLVRRVSEWLAKSRPAADAVALPAADDRTPRRNGAPRAMPDAPRWLVGREPASGELLCYMLHAANIDPGAIPPDIMRLLERRCIACTVKFHCADELGRGRAGTTLVEFCPNAATLRSLQTRAA